jgi:hypothetical protein
MAIDLYKLMQTNGLHQPNPKNSLEPYFPKATVRKCGKDVRQVLGHFPTSIIEALIAELKKRAVSGSFAHTDLLGTLARILTNSSEKDVILEKRKVLYSKIGRPCSTEYRQNFEWWFAQVSGRPSLGDNVSKHRCRFTEITTHWCREVIAGQFPRDEQAIKNAR